MVLNCWGFFIFEKNRTMKKTVILFFIFVSIQSLYSQEKNNSPFLEPKNQFKVVIDSKEYFYSEGDELEILGILIDKYESEHFPIELPDPIEAIKFRMEQLNYSQNDLAEVIGLKSRASEILNKKRKLSLEMIRKLTEKLHIPSEVLIQAY